MQFKKISKFAPYIIIFFLGFSIGGYAIFNQVNDGKTSEHIIDKQENERILELKILGKTIEENLNLSGKNDFEKAIIIRNHLYQNVPTKNLTRDGIRFNFLDILKGYYSSIYDPKIGHICQGNQILYMLWLKSQNIPSRRVQIFDTIEYPYNSHASVEFYYKGKWYASDPQFNIMYRNKNKYLSYLELYHLIKSDKSYEITSNEFPIIDIPSKNIEKYYIGIEKLIENLIVDEVKTIKNGRRIAFDGIVIPKDSKGIIKQKGGKQYNAKDNSSLSSIYQFIYNAQVN